MKLKVVMRDMVTKQELALIKDLHNETVLDKAQEWLSAHGKKVLSETVDEHPAGVTFITYFVYDDVESLTLYDDFQIEKLQSGALRVHMPDQTYTDVGTMQEALDQIDNHIEWECLQDELEYEEW